MLIISALTASMTAFAFSDMEEERLSWAKEAVEKMNSAGIIKGYTDGTFKPDKAVTKEEAMVLVARICGFTEDSSKEYIEIANAVCKDMLKDYSTQYESEVSYMIYRGIVSSSDLPAYFSGKNASTALKRYEAAILLSKLVDYNCTISEKSRYDLTFIDAGSIPESAKAYVEYAVNNKLMNGMGDNMFQPDGEVTRAQMATLLYRAMNKLEFKYETGIFSEYSESSSSIKIVDSKNAVLKYTANNNTPVMYNGAEADLNDIAPGDEIRLTLTGNTVAFAEAVSSDSNDSIEGIFVQISKLTDSTVIVVKDPITENEKQYAVSDAVVVKRNNTTSALTSLEKGDNLKITLKNGKVSVVVAEDKTSTLTGVIESIELEPEFKLNIEVENETKSYGVYDSVTVKRNGSVGDLSSLMAGDNVSLTLEYGVISKITATSKQTKKSGKVSEIVISASPRITVKTDDETHEYYVRNSVKIYKNTTEAEIYDIRIGDSVTVTVEGETVTEINLTSAAESATITGEITYQNTSYGYIQLSGVPELVFTSKAKVQDKSGAAMNTKSLTTGKNVTVFGTAGVGSIEATLIIVNN